MFPGSGIPRRRRPSAGAILAIVFGSSLSAATVGGVVVARQDSRKVPVFRAVVVAREAAGSDIQAVARTDREGRFLIVGLASPRIVLSVQREGYYTSSVNGRQGESVVLDCSAPQDCGAVEFELAKSAVVSGMVVDELGEPAAAVAVAAVLGDASQSESDRNIAGAETDDRGYFRIAGLQPGHYILKSEGPRSRFRRGLQLQGDPVEVELVEGREADGVQITMRTAAPPEGFSVSGRIAGVDLSGNGTHFLLVRSQARGDSQARGRGYSTGVRVDKDGSFSFDSLRPGRYGFVYSHRANRSGSLVTLGTVEVSGDLSNLLLRPVPPTGFSGAVKFETQRTPRQVLLYFFPEQQEDPFTAIVSGPDFDFRMTNLPAGKYDVAVYERGEDSTAFFAKGIRRGTELLPSRGFVIGEGVVENVEVIVSDELARIYGRIKAADAGAAGGIREGAQFQVGLWGPNRRVRLAQADQYGRFQFERVAPGDYRICAWSDLDPRFVHDEGMWEKAGNAVREFPVEAASDVEIDLTAVP